jgi:hypothetical protein
LPDGHLGLDYPAVVEQTDRTLILVYHHIEGGGIWSWVKWVAETGLDKKGVAVSSLDPNMTPIPLRNYGRCFPVKYNQFTGFAPDI